MKYIHPQLDWESYLGPDMLKSLNLMPSASEYPILRRTSLFSAPFPGKVAISSERVVLNICSPWRLFFGLIVWIEIAAEVSSHSSLLDALSRET